ncbi:MAG: hypothetical protein Q8P90_04055 [bacterium]|nr:hypothetical protein [bacterium]
MASKLERYRYEPTDTTLTLTSDKVLHVQFGHATSDLHENTTESKWTKQKFDEIKSKYPDDYILVLLDMRNIGDAEFNSKESNDLYREMLQDEYTKKVAIVGISSGWELLLKFFLKFADNKMMSFKYEEEARAWLVTD